MPRDETAGRIYSVPVPGELDREVRTRIERGGFGSLSEYVRSAIRADLEKARQDELEKKLLRAVDRGEFKDVTPELWDGLRRGVRLKRKERQRGS